MSEIADTRSLKKTLSCASLEAYRIASHMSRIDAALGKIIDVSELSAFSLQSADILRQEIEGLASFLKILSDRLPVEIQCDATGAVSRLKLNAQAQRLLGRPVSSEQTPMIDDLWCLNNDGHSEVPYKGD